MIFEFNIKTIELIITLSISLTALLISIIALCYTIRTFLLKSGHQIRCDMSTVSTVDCDDNYISSITLENLKDRATVIFSIYLELGRGNYLLLENFEKSPLILKPFEVYYKEFEPILFYSVNLNRVELNHLLNNWNIHRNIILSTTDGKYTVKTHTRKWSPTPEFFKNYLTAIVSPKRLPYKGKSYGNNVKYLVELKKSGFESTVIAFKEGDHRLKQFQNFQITEDALKNSNNLKQFFTDLKYNNILKFDELKIIDFQDRVSKISEDYKMESIKLGARNYFKYHILGRLFTRWENRRLRKKNRQSKNNAPNIT